MRRILLACALTLSVVAGGCGVGTETVPHRLDPKGVPFGLLASATTTTSATPGAQAHVVIYLLARQHLMAVNRAVARTPDATAALKELGTGPSAAESAEGLTSPISSAAPLRLEAVRSGVASVNVPSSFESLGGQDQIVAAAQIVFTLTAVPGVSGVVLLVDGQATQVPTAGGSLSRGPLTRADYAPLTPS